MAKTINHKHNVKSREENGGARRYVHHGVRKHLITGENLDTSANYLYDIGKLWIAFCVKAKRADKRKFIVLTDFLIEHGLRQRTWYNWLKQNPEFKEDYEEGRAILNAHSLCGLAEGDFDYRVVLPTQHLDNPEWKEGEDRIDDRQAKSKSNLQEHVGVKYVLVERDPESDIVTEKLKVKNGK